MNKRIAVEISVLGGAIGFFAGGLLGLKKDIVDMLLFAVIGGTGLSFMVYFAVNLIFNEELNGESSRRKAPSKNTEKEHRTKKGVKIDVVSDEKDDIYDEIFK